MEKEKDKKEWLEGSFTVEAAVVVSVTILVLTSLILCAFFVHDRAVMQSACCEAAAAGSIFSTEKDRNCAAEKVKKQVSSARLLGSREVSSQAGSGKSKANASWSGVFPMPGFAVRFFSGKNLQISKTWTCSILKPADTIRKIRGAGNLLSGGK